MCKICNQIDFENVLLMSSKGNEFFSILRKQKIKKNEAINCVRTCKDLNNLKNESRYAFEKWQSKFTFEVKHIGTLQFK